MPTHNSVISDLPLSRYIFPKRQNTFSHIFIPTLAQIPEMHLAAVTPCIYPSSPRNNLILAEIAKIPAATFSLARPRAAVYRLY